MYKKSEYFLKFIKSGFFQKEIVNEIVIIHNKKTIKTVLSVPEIPMVTT